MANSVFGYKKILFIMKKTFNSEGDIALEIGATTNICSFEKTTRQTCDPHRFTGSGGMDKLPFADIHPDMGDPFTPFGCKEDQISRLQVAFRYITPCFELGTRVAGKIETVQAVADHRQPAAIKAVTAVFSAPAVGNSEKSPGGQNQFRAQAPLTAVLDFGSGVVFRRNNKIFINYPFGVELFSFLVGDQ